MYSGLLIILLPLSLGYLIHLNNKSVLAQVHQLLNVMVYIILVLMGVSLAMLENLGNNLLSILLYATTFFSMYLRF